MSVSSTQPVIVCHGCGKKLKWKPEVAGKRARCACGVVLSIPLQPPASSNGTGAPPASDPAPPAVGVRVPLDQRPATAPSTQAATGKTDPDDPYALAPDPDAGYKPAPVMKKSASMPAAPGPIQHVPSHSAPTPVPAHGDAATPGSVNDVLVQRLGALPSDKLKKRREEREAERHQLEEEFEGSPVRDVVLPLIIIPIGIVLSFLEIMRFVQTPTSFGEAIPQVFMRLAMAVGLMLGGMFLAITALEVTFLSTYKKSILRFIAIAVGPSAIYGILNHAIGGDIGGPAAGTFASVAVYAFLFWGLMKTDLQSTAICTVVTWVMVAFSNYIAFRAEGMMGEGWL